MKQIYNIILTALTIAMLLLLTFAKLNEFGEEEYNNKLHNI